MRLEPPKFMPRDWPVVEPDLLMGYVGSTLVIRMERQISAHGFARYIEEWTRSVDARPTHASVFALYDIPQWPGISAMQRKTWAERLKSREATLRRTTRGMVLATPSAVARAAVRALFWFAPPPYPVGVVDTPQAAFAHIAQRGGPPAEVLRVGYDAFIARHSAGQAKPPSSPVGSAQNR